MGNSYSDKFFEQLLPFLEKVKEIKKVILNDVFTSRTSEILPALKFIN